uniref:Uncharacterized protein n=1 Tax=Chrysemys picta bellii TaxID=8478 RepID=A0A8C3ICL1_CHRPI|nr:tumor necrosis factor receptor superfamily member 5 [Chrysemys picta bellii]
MIKEKCTYTKNTVCGCVPGDFCPHPAGLDCEICSPYTICLPGSMVKIPGTEFLDNVCEVCPEGTFSATNMLRTCQPWTRCEEEGMREQKAGTATSDAICVRRGLSTTAIALIIVLALSLLSAFAGTAFFLWRRRKRKDGRTRKSEKHGTCETCQRVSKGVRLAEFVLGTLVFVSPWNMPTCNWNCLFKPRIPVRV